MARPSGVPQLDEIFILFTLTFTRHGDDYARDYLTDVIRRKAVRFLKKVYKVQTFFS